MSSSPTLAAPGLSQRLTLVIEALRQAVARAGRDRAKAPLVLLVWAYLRRLAARFDALASRVQTGGPPAPAPSRRPAATRAPARLSPRLPQRFAWLIGLAPETAALASQVQHLLFDPEMATLLAAAPQAGRILRPLCWMLAIRPGPGLPPTLFSPGASPRPPPTPIPPTLRAPTPPWTQGSAESADGHAANFARPADRPPRA